MCLGHEGHKLTSSDSLLGSASDSGITNHFTGTDSSLDKSYHDDSIS